MPYRPNFPIPENIHAETFCLCIQVPNDPVWKQVVAGLLDELNQWYNWQRNEERSGKECAQVWRALYAQIDWTTMSCCCDEFGKIFQWTVEGILQVSIDGGETWTDDPTQDPRNSSPTYPPVPGEPSDDKKCIAATGMKMLVKEQVGDQLTDDMSRYTLGQLVNDWVTTIIQTSNPFQALINIVTNQIFALIIAVLRPALTDDVYNKLMCAFLDHMESDLSFTQSDWEAVRSQITTDISGIAGVFLEHLVYLLGKVGLTNLARSQAALTGDCSCGDGCDSSLLWDIKPPGIANGVIDSGTRTAENLEVVGDVVGGDGRYYIQLVAPTSADCCTLTGLGITGSPFDILIAWDLCGETPGSYAHSGTISDVVGQSIVSLMVRTVNASTTTLTF